MVAPKYMALYEYGSLPPSVYMPLAVMLIVLTPVVGVILLAYWSI